VVPTVTRDWPIVFVNVFIAATTTTTTLLLANAINSYPASILVL
jgi:hypothetical protein